MTTTAYLVTVGEYSDYSVDSVFLDKRMAERYAMTMNGKPEEPYDYAEDYGYGYSVQPEVITEELPEFRQILHLFWRSVLTYHLGNPAKEEKQGEGTTECKEWSELDSNPELHFTPACCHDTVLREARKTTPYYEVRVWGYDHEQVRKVYAEQVAQAKAQLEDL